MKVGKDCDLQFLVISRFISSLSVPCWFCLLKQWDHRCFIIVNIVKKWNDLLRRKWAPWLCWGGGVLGGSVSKMTLYLLGILIWWHDGFSDPEKIMYNTTHILEAHWIGFKSMPLPFINFEHSWHFCIVLFLYLWNGDEGIVMKIFKDIEYKAYSSVTDTRNQSEINVNYYSSSFNFWVYVFP